MFPIQLGLKASCAPEQVASRLKYHTDVFEFLDRKSVGRERVC